MSQPPRQLHLNVNILHSGFIPSAWRLPHADPLAFIDAAHYVKVARIAEAAKFDAVFLADNAAIIEQIDFRPITALEPTVLLATVAAATTHIGVIGTASTSYNEPYNIARRFATLDHVSGGRAGWNIVTTADVASARNFGLEKVPDHAARYARADEFTQVVKSLWNSWEDEALVADKASGRFIDDSRVHPIAHRGSHFQVHGPLNLPRTPQASRYWYRPADREMARSWPHVTRRRSSRRPIPWKNRWPTAAPSIPAPHNSDAAPMRSRSCRGWPPSSGPPKPRHCADATN